MISNAEQRAPEPSPSWPSSSEHFTIARRLEHWARQQPDALCLRDLSGSVAVDYSFAALLAAVQRIAAGLMRHELEAGSTVAVLADNGAGLVTALLGIQVAGAVSLALYPPGITPGAATRARLTEQLRGLGARALVVAPELEDESLLDRAALERAGLRVFSWSELDQPAGEVPLLGPLEPSALAHLQCTSGSTGQRRAVLLSHQNLVDNAHAIALGMRVTRQDRTFSWLPIAHDMGFIGGVLMPLTAGVPVALMRPNRFVCRPAAWLRAMSAFRATLTFSPNFGYQRCVNTVGPDDCEGLDLSDLRLAVVASEPVFEATVSAFERRFGAAGLRPGVLRPGYGLAELTVGATLYQPERSERFASLSYAALTGEGTARPPLPGEVSISVACVGEPLPGVELFIRDRAGRPVADGEVGEVTLRGRMVAQGYLNDARATAATFAGDELRSGDLGFLRDGQLYICGRSKDLIIVAGKNYHPQDIEATVLEVEGVRAAAALGVCSAATGTEGVVLVVGAALRDSAQVELLGDRCRKAVLLALGVSLADLAVVRPGELPKTTSGKLQRHECKRIYLERWQPSARLANGGDGLRGR